jgi:hypothetical protein
VSYKDDLTVIVRRLDQLVVTDFFDIHPELRAEFVGWIETLNQIVSPGNKPLESPEPPLAAPPPALASPSRSAPKPAAKPAPRVPVKTSTHRKRY